MNVSDAERVSAVLESAKYERTQNMSEADLIAVVMCSVRQSAVDRVFGLAEKFRKLRATNYKLQTILTGCILKKDRKTFSNLFDEVVDIKDLQNPKIAPKYFSKTRAFLPISNGCNNSCSYCVVPYTRGKLVCRGHKEIIEEAKRLANPPSPRLRRAKKIQPDFIIDVGNLKKSKPSKIIDLTKKKPKILRP